MGWKQASRAFIFVYSCINVFLDRNREGLWPAPSTVEFGEFYRLCYYTYLVLFICIGRFQRRPKKKNFFQNGIQIIFLCCPAGRVKIYVTGLVWYVFYHYGHMWVRAKSERSLWEYNTVRVFFIINIKSVISRESFRPREKESRAWCEQEYRCDT